MSLVAFLGACSTFPAAPPAPGQPPISGDWRLIGHDDKGATSGCIGRPGTALCAVETLLACFQWGRAELCRMVDDDAEQYATVFDSPVDPASYLAYRVVQERRAAPGETDIVIDQQAHADGQAIDPGGGTKSGFHLRKEPDGRWKIVGWDDIPAE